jgi:hypothetical protein
MDIFYGGGQWVGSGGTPLGGGTQGTLNASTSGSPGGPYGVVNSQSLNVMGQIGQYGGGRWVYLGTFSNPDGNLAVSSTFGGSFSITNVAGASINPNNINQMWYGDNTFVAVGNSNTAYTSTDGFNWTSRNPQLGGQSAITATYGNGTWLIGGTTNSLSASTNNGVTWTPLNGPGFGSDGIFCSGYNPNTGVFMVAGGGGKLATSQAPGGTTTLTIANAQADGFLVGNTIGSSPAGAGPGTIISLDNSQVVVSPASNTWGIGLALATDPSSYTQILNIVGSASLVSLAISKPPLVANTPYYVRVRYNATSPSAISSPYSNFNKFTTGSL